MQIPSITQSPANRAAALVKLMQESAQDDYIGESISQLEHSLQCAHLAAKAGELSTFLLNQAPTSTVFICSLLQEVHSTSNSSQEATTTR